MEEFTLVRDFAIIMAVAGAVTLLCRKLRQPPILGYLIAGVIIGPYVLPIVSVQDVHTIRLLAELGLVLLLFGLGLEFSWSRIREIGLTALIIGIVEIFTMFFLGYGLGRAMGWSGMDALFLGAALHISSSAIIVKILRDLGRLNFTSSRLIVGILVVEDFAAVIIITVLSGVATTGVADLGDVGSLIWRLVVFTIASLTLGAIIVPRIIRFARQFNSKEVLLITGLGLCFGMALLSRYLGLSVAAGAFLIGALIGDTKKSEEIVEIMTPVRDMFAALFFVTIGMLIDIGQARGFIVPAVIVCIVFMVGKILSNTIITFFSGYDGKTALQVGMGMPQMGEFSLAIAKVGIDKGAIVAPLYPSIAVATAISSFITPYLTRSTDSIADFLARRAPAMPKAYFSRLADWVQVMRAMLARDSRISQEIKSTVKQILINILIVIVILGVSAFTVQFVDELANITRLRAEIVGVLFAIAVLMLCMPAVLIVWRDVRKLIDNATDYLLARRHHSAKGWRHEALRTVLRNSIVIVLAIFVAMWSVPLIVQLLSIGSFSIAVPVLLIAVLLFLVVGSTWQIHGQLERNLSRTLLGEEGVSSPETLMISPLKIRSDQGILARLTQMAKMLLSKSIACFFRRLPKRKSSDKKRNAD